VIAWGGRTVTVRHTPFDLGSLGDLFDGDPATLVRTAGINPAVVEIEFGEPVRLTGVWLTVGATDLDVTIRVFADEEAAPGRYVQTFTGLPPDPMLELMLEPPSGPVRRLTIEIRDLNGLASHHVHLRDISLLEE
jgi:hypothetical protein